MSQPEKYSKEQVDAAFSDAGFTVSNQKKGWVWYYVLNDQDPDDCMIDWSIGAIPWGDLKKHLETQGIDAESIHKYLISH